jgi:hypothetical protein
MPGGSARSTVQPVAEVSVVLSSDEALVLFELLHRWEDAGWYERADLLPGRTHRAVAVSGHLESILVDPFKENYRELVDQCGERLRERSGEQRDTCYRHVRARIAAFADVVRAMLVWGSMRNSSPVLLSRT